MDPCGSSPSQQNPLMMESTTCRLCLYRFKHVKEYRSHKFFLGLIVYAVSIYTEQEQIRRHNSS